MCGLRPADLLGGGGNSAQGEGDSESTRMRASWVRDVTPSLRNTLTRWYSTELVLMKSCAAIS